MLFKLSNLNPNLALTLGYLNPALNNSALLLNLRATLPIWSIRFYKSALSCFVTLFLLNLSEVIDLPCPRPVFSLTISDNSLRSRIRGDTTQWIWGPWSTLDSESRKRTKLVCVRTKLKKSISKVHVIINSMAKSLSLPTGKNFRSC